MERGIVGRRGIEDGEGHFVVMVAMILESLLQFSALRQMLNACSMQNSTVEQKL